MVISTFVALNGLGLIIAGLVPTDPVDSPDDLLTLSAGDLAHAVAASVGLVSAVIAVVVGARVFTHDRNWRPLAL
jgi:hypothetical protein